MSVRRLVVAVDPESLNVTRFCAEHNISTWFFWDLRRRYRRDGEAVLEPRSRAPHNVANKTPAHIEELIVRTRKELDDSGWDCGPASIHDRLVDLLTACPSEATIWRVLHRYGLIESDPSKAPRTHKSFTAERVNEVWAIDDTGAVLADGTQVKIFNAVDDCSRLAVASEPMVSCSGTAAFNALANAAAIVGWPSRFWSDQAKAYTETLATAVEPLGITPSHTRPYSPNSNGKVERFHQTQAKWLAKQPAPTTLEQLGVLLDWFQLHYNHNRKHRGLDRRTPADVWINTAKTGPASVPLGTTTRIHTGIVHGGRIDTGHRTRISLGAAHNGQTATAIITGYRAHVFINGDLVRELTINPAKRTQTLYDRAGQPRRQTERKDPRHV